MRDILNTIYHDGPLMLVTLSCLENPQCEEERKVAVQLRAVNQETAEALIPSIEALADRQAEQSFYIGVRFGAQLMKQLLEGLS